MLSRQGDPVEVLPWLYIGNAYHAAQEDRLTALGISALLNVAEAEAVDGGGSGRHGAPLPGEGGAGRASSISTFCHMSIPIVDSATADIGGKFPDAIDFIGNEFFYEKHQTAF